MRQTTSRLLMMYGFSHLLDNFGRPMCDACRIFNVVMSLHHEAAKSSETTHARTDASPHAELNAQHVDNVTVTSFTYCPLRGDIR